MKHYFLIKTTDNEYSSSYKYIAETFDEAYRVLMSGKYTDWYATEGNGNIVEVDQTFRVLHTHHYWNGELWEVDYKRVK